jgi:hypothetical protein
MLTILFVLFFACYFFCLRKKIILLFICVFAFSITFLYKIFGSYFIDLSRDLNVNLWVLLFGVLYFYFWFLSFYYLSCFGLPGVLLHSLVMVLLSFLKLIFPLHPFILLYQFNSDLLPRTGSTFFNLFSLFFLSCVLFCQSSLYLRWGAVISLVVFFLMSNQFRQHEKIDLKIAIVQVGLYFEKGGTTKFFFRDFFNFLNNHPEVNAVVFSENNFFTYKSEYNKGMSEQLLSNIRQNNLHHTLHLFLSFSGYKDFNNVITLYMFEGITTINQKKTLIPFIEKPGLFNSNNSLYSPFYTVNKKHKNKLFEIQGSSVSTHICYDALFPEIDYQSGDIAIIQSNYMLLDKGHGFERLKQVATYLAKFIIGMKSKIVINIQNTGGTVVLLDGWRIDNETYETSKNEPFFVIDTNKL